MRFALPFFGALALATPAMSHSEGKTPVASAIVVERTYLKAEPGKRDALKRFIVANWFAMDRIAVKQGLFTSYRLSENLDPSADWDVEVAVGYPNPEGYRSAQVQARFEAIRKAHTTVAIGGEDLRTLGKIVRTDRIAPKEGQ